MTVDLEKPTWHLNLKYSVGDMDRVNFIRMNRRLNVEEICGKLHGTRLSTTPLRVRQLAREFSINVRPSPYEYGG